MKNVKFVTVRGGKVTSVKSKNTGSRVTVVRSVRRGGCGCG